jgi:hypothetical protein
MAVLLLSSFNLFAQVPVYSSYPSASATIFLDFDGHTLNGTSWNTNGPIVCGPSNLTSDQITEIFNRIAEDYRPFNVNITTDSTKYSAAPATRRMRVLFTITNSWYGNNAGGVAYTGSFTWGDNTPCFIFTALLNYNTKFISEAGAHEAGHTLGLRHQAAYDANCVKTSDYNYGYGSGETSWAPIMGVGYYRNFTTWHNGSNPYGCTNVQNDLSVITSATNGFGYRTDDYGDTFNSATNLSFSANQFGVNGLVSTNTDKDLFKFSLSSQQQFKLSALPTSVGDGDAGSNLDMAIQLYDASKNLISTYNPEQSLSVSVDTTLDAGDYYMQVNATGNTYSSGYGSLGSYTLMAEESPLATLPVHRLELKGLVQSGSHKLNWIIEADETVVHQDLEVSADGKNFKPLSEIKTDTRLYSYSPELTGTIFYRLNVKFDNNRQYFSNTIAMRSNGNAGRPRLFSNVINGNALMVNSPENYNYVVMDYNGKAVAKGRVSEGSSSVITSYLPAGTYVIRFNNGDAQYSEKFIRQ